MWPNSKRALNRFDLKNVSGKAIDHDHQGLPLIRFVYSGTIDDLPEEEHFTFDVAGDAQGM